MKKILFAVLAAMVLWRVNAVETQWLTDLPKAQAQAKAENKIVLMDFTGSDWCPWCIKFKKEVLDTAEFQEYAAKNVVLVELDYPSKKVQSAELKKANAALKDPIRHPRLPDAGRAEQGRQGNRPTGRLFQGRPEGVHRQAGKIQDRELSQSIFTPGRGLK